MSLIHAAAGFGKTSCLAQWKGALALAGIRVAWLSLDTDDDDIHMFIAYVAAAVNRACPEAGRDVMELVARNGSLARPAALLTLLTLLVNGIASARESLVLMLDDYHFITKPEIHDWLAGVCSVRAENLFVALAARSLPPVRLAGCAPPRRSSKSVPPISPHLRRGAQSMRMTADASCAPAIDARERTRGLPPVSRWS